MTYSFSPFRPPLSFCFTTPSSSSMPFFSLHSPLHAAMRSWRCPGSAANHRGRVVVCGAGFVTQSRKEEGYFSLDCRPLFFSLARRGRPAIFARRPMRWLAVVGSEEKKKKKKKQKQRFGGGSNPAARRHLISCQCTPRVLLITMELPDPVFVPSMPPPGTTPHLSFSLLLLSSRRLSPSLSSPNLFLFFSHAHKRTTSNASPSLHSIPSRSARAGGRVGSSGRQASVQRRGACVHVLPPIPPLRFLISDAYCTHLCVLTIVAFQLFFTFKQQKFVAPQNNDET